MIKRDEFNDGLWVGVLLSFMGAFSLIVALVIGNGVAKHVAEKPARVPGSEGGE